MKYMIVLLFFVTACITVNAFGIVRSPYDNDDVVTNIPCLDAITISNLVKNGHTQKLLDFLNRSDYFQGQVGSDAALKTVIAGNTYLEEAFKSVTKAVALDSLNNLKANFFIQLDVASSFFETSGTPAVAGDIGGIDVTNIANGIAQFMIKRAKQELTVAFFERFDDFVKANPEFQILFPKTVDNLHNLLAFHYPDMIKTLRTGFVDDLGQLVFHLDEVLTLPRYQQLLKNLPEVRIAIRSIRIVQELQDPKSHPAEILTEFAGYAEWTAPTAGTALKNFGAGVKVANLISNSLRNPDDDMGLDDLKKTWISPAEMRALISDKDAFTIYMGILARQAQIAGINFYKDAATVVSFFDVLIKQKDNLFLVQNNLVKFIQLTEEFQNALTAINTKKTNRIALTNDDYYSYINTGINVIEYGFGLARFFDKDLGDIGAYSKIARQADDLYRNIFQKQYSQAVTNAMNVLQEILNLVHNNNMQNNGTLNATLASINTTARTDLGVTHTALIVPHPASIDKLSKSEQKKVGEMLDNATSVPAANQDPALIANLKMIQTAVATRDTLGKLSNIIDKLTKYGTFIANMASASTPDEVSDILENAVLPVGSSSIKKDAIWNFSVQSYLGAYRLTSHPKKDLNVTWTSQYGMIAPIGLSFSHGLKQWGSASVFVPLLDLGAIVDYQLKYDSLTSAGGHDSAVSKDYKIKLGQIFSPGLYLVYGFPFKIPLAFGFGTQYGPGLSKINIDGTAQVNNPSWRWNIFLAVDIPFFTLYNKSRTKR